MLCWIMGWKILQQTYEKDIHKLRATDMVQLCSSQFKHAAINQVKMDQNHSMPSNTNRFMTAIGQLKKSEKIQGGLIHIPCTRHSSKTANENFQTLAKTPWMHRSLHNIWGWYFNKCFYFVAGKPIRILILSNFVRTPNSMDLNMANFWWLHMFQFSGYLMAKMKWIPSHIHQSKKMLFPSCYSVDYIHQHVPSA